ncbi:Hypothetical glycosyl hydrolase 6 [Alkalispirochaeta americana]|uniref:Hypothetical glycosyl hydrolase 6 n=1 Tax=Alkalispirochaeta americana TaxID=159291 RepID=A0A1N6Q9C8_9SPIO|nr:alpha-L-fucosidase [Alkalispirochaeta americana]SIQ13108.1 Hypothetical glycosyl hydrolase 6 [Alkalispirochaeta americana]
MTDQTYSNPGQSHLSFRQVHLDFHTSGHIGGVGADFDPEEFAERLATAHVDSITCFARCHHGYLYYQSEKHPHLIHPHLERTNLLDEQIHALRERGIRVPLYTTVQWDGWMMREHPEWCCQDEHGGWHGQRPLEAGFYATLCVNTPYRDFLFDHTRELLERFAPQGLFFDIVRDVPCLCPWCLSGMEQEGLDPWNEEDRMIFARHVADRFRLEMSEMIRRTNPECAVFYNASHVAPRLRSSLESFSHLEIESLPSGGWGYTHFPYVVRYAQGLGKEMIGMTGRFHTYWGDFHSYKNKAALEFECFQMLAHGAGCSVGDQLVPSGKLDMHAYELIGDVFQRVQAVEPWVRGTRPLGRIALVTTEEWSQSEQPLEMIGAVRILQECGFQFSVIDLASDTTPYELLIFPDKVPVTSRTKEFVDSFLAGGGRVLATFDATFPTLGVVSAPQHLCDGTGEDPHGRVYERNDFADYLVPLGPLGRDLPETPHVMYLRGREVIPGEKGRVELSITPSFFDRSPRRYCSHQQSPPDRSRTGLPAVISTDRSLYFAHPLFTTYCERSPRWVKLLVRNAVEELIGQDVCSHDGPSGLISTVRYHPEKRCLLVHLLYYVPERRGRSLDVIEDVVPLHDLTITLRPRGKFRISRAEIVPDQQILPILAGENDEVRITVPCLQGAAIIACSCQGVP